MEEAERLHKQPAQSGQELHAIEGQEQLRKCLIWVKNSSLLNGLRATSNDEYPPRPSTSSIKEIRLGLGSPGYNGCLAVSAQTARWEVLTDRRCGVLAAMDHLGLHLVAMPGARLAPGAAIPGMKDIRIVARGGPDYGSTAFIWRTSVLGDSISEALGIGSARRLPVSVTSEHGLSWIVQLYLPPLQGSTREEEWNHELNGLGADLVELRARTPSSSDFRLLLIGDINLEPSELGGSGTLGSNRRRRWSMFLGENGLVMRSPASNSQETHEVHLPLRDRFVRVGNGCTHHCPGKAGAIDVVASTPNNEVDVLVHNGLHCKHAGSCSWPLCVEYTLGDHFLVQASVKHVSVPPDSSSFRMPAWWQDTQACDAGLLAAQGLLELYNQMLRNMCESLEASNRGKRIHLAPARW